RCGIRWNALIFMDVPRDRRRCDSVPNGTAALPAVSIHSPTDRRAGPPESSATQDPSVKRGAWSQREPGGGEDVGSGEQRELVTLSHRGDDHLHLHGGEGASDAAARTAAKGKVGKRRARGGAGHDEAVRIETLGVVPYLRMAVSQVRAQQDERLRRDDVPADRIVLTGRAGGEPRGRAEAERLLDRAARVAEPG